MPTLDEQQVAAILPCVCSPDYTKRGLTQPDCPRCNYGEEVADAIGAARLAGATTEREAVLAIIDEETIGENPGLDRPTSDWVAGQNELCKVLVERIHQRGEEGK